jgi:hypothetical protein
MNVDRVGASVPAHCSLINKGETAMTSDMSAGTKSSVAREQLDIALGEKRVSLEALSPRELDDLLREHFREIPLSEIRGFQTLSAVLVRRGDYPLVIAEGARLVSPNMSVTFTSQMRRFCRGLYEFSGTYRRHESNEETDDPQVAQQWGESAYLAKGVERVILMHRKTSFRAHEGLTDVVYSYTKVPHKNLHEINHVNVSFVPLYEFSSYFGERAPGLALELIWEMESAIGNTCDALERQLTSMRKKHAVWQRFSNSVSG